MSDDKEKELSFESYNAMGRLASYQGVPQFVLFTIIISGAVIVGIFLSIFGWWGLISVIIPITVFFIVRQVCETDSRFLTRFKFCISRYIRNMKYGRTLLITPQNQQWSNFYGRRISQKRYANRNKSAVNRISRS